MSKTYGKILRMPKTEGLDISEDFFHIEENQSGFSPLLKLQWNRCLPIFKLIQHEL